MEKHLKKFRFSYFVAFSNNFDFIGLFLMHGVFIVSFTSKEKLNVVDSLKCTERFFYKKWWKRSKRVRT